MKKRFHFGNIPLKEWLSTKDMFVGLIIPSLFSSILALVFPLALLQVYDRVVPNQAFDTLYFLFVGVLIAILVDLLLKILMGYVATWADVRLCYQSGRKSFNHLLNSNLHAVKQKAPGVWLNRLNAVDNLKDFYGGRLILILLEIPFTIIYIGMISYLAGVLVLIPILMGVLLFVSLYFHSAGINRVLSNKEDEKERKDCFSIEMLAGIQTIKTRGLEEQMLRRYEKLLEGNIQDDYEYVEKNGYAVRTVNFFSQLNVILIVTFGSILVINDMLSVGAIAATIILGSRSLVPIHRFIQLWTWVHRIELAEAGEREILSLPQESSKDMQQLDAINGHIKMKDVSFRYPNRQKLVLDNVSLDIPAGSCVVITGEADSGRSTLLGLISGIYEPISGTVSIDGQDISKVSKKSIRAHIAAMYEGEKLFEGTVLDNLTLFADDEFTIRNAKKITQELGVAEAIEKLPAGYNTKVGVGANEHIPSGLRQRIAIARAMISNPKIILSDDASIGLDISADKQLKKYLENMKSKATVVIVTHRPSIINLADVVYELKNGHLNKREVK